MPVNQLLKPTRFAVSAFASNSLRHEISGLSWTDGSRCAWMTSAGLRESEIWRLRSLVLNWPGVRDYIIRLERHQ